MIIKKAAMFGLDARIALAIFGALSVISGAALYSAIQESKVIQLITNLNEIGKAYEAYILDTGSEIEKEFNVFGLTGRLLSDGTPSIAGWNGPYLSANEYITVSNNYIRHPQYKDYVVLDFAEDTDWTSVTDNRASGAPCITANTTCWVWVRIQSDFSYDLMKAVDLKIDGDNSPRTGKFRYRYLADNALQEAYLKYSPALYQPNQ